MRSWLESAHGCRESIKTNYSSSFLTKVAILNVVKNLEPFFCSG